MITSMTDMVNAACMMPIGTGTIQIKRLSLGEIWALAEQGLKTAKFQEATELALSMKLTSDERVKFMRNVILDLPKGEALQEAALNWLNTPSGINSVLVLAIKNTGSILKEADITEILKQGTTQQLIDLAAWCIGADNLTDKTESPKVESPK